MVYYVVLGVDGQVQTVPLNDLLNSVIEWLHHSIDPDLFVEAGNWWRYRNTIKIDEKHSADVSSVCWLISPSNIEISFRICLRPMVDL